MANQIHKDLEDIERHLPKGFESASPPSALIKNESGELEYRDLATLGTVGPQGPVGPAGDAIDNIVIVQKNPGSQQFLTITSALASITDASSSNNYLIAIGPGIYVEDTLTMKEYVYIQGSGESTVIQPDDPSKNIINGITNSGIVDCVLEGATGVGFAAVKMVDGAANSEFFMFRINFGSNYHFVLVDSTGGDASVVINSCRPTINTITVQPFYISGTGNGLLKISSFNGTLHNPLLNIIDFIYISGSTNEIIVSVLSIALKSGATGDHGVHAEDGSSIRFNSVQLTGFDRGIYLANVGSAPIIKANPITLLDSIIEDIFIEHPDSSGVISGIATRTKVTIDENTSIALNILDPDAANNDGIITLGDLIQGDRYDRILNLSTLARESGTMGVLSGGLLSDGGGLNVNITAGVGYLEDTVDQFVKEISWAADVETISPNASRYIYVNTNGIVTNSATLPDLKENIILGRVVTLSVNIHYIENTPMRIGHYDNESAFFNREALGPVYASGSVVTENNITDRALNITAGKYWFGTNRFQPSGGSPILFSLFFRAFGGSGFNVILSVTQINNTDYDDGSGALVPLPLLKFAKHSLYVVGEGIDEKYFVVMPQEVFDTLVEAEAGNIPTPPASFDDSVALIASIIVQQGQSNLIKILDNRPILGFKAPTISASADHGNLLGLADDDHQQYLLIDGSRSMSSNLSLGGNSIIDVGLVDGIDPSNHGSRHNPNNADAITTAAPIAATVGAANNIGTANSIARSDHVHGIGAAAPSEISDSTNSIGTANTFVRSDHIHAHGNRGGGTLHSAATPSSNGFLSSTDKTKLDRLDVGHLSYSNSVLQTTTSLVFVNVLLQSDRESFTNSLFTKVSNTDFRADFNGQVKVSYSVSVYTGANDRGAVFAIQRNATDVTWTQKGVTGRASVAQQRTVTGTFILNCAINDIFRLRYLSSDGTDINIPIDAATMSVEVYRKT